MENKRYSSTAVGRLPTLRDNYSARPCRPQHPTGSGVFPWTTHGIAYLHTRPNHGWVHVTSSSDVCIQGSRTTYNLRYVLPRVQLSTAAQQKTPPSHCCCRRRKNYQRVSEPPPPVDMHKSDGSPKKQLRELIDIPRELVNNHPCYKGRTEHPPHTASGYSLRPTLYGRHKHSNR